MDEVVGFGVLGCGVWVGVSKTRAFMVGGSFRVVDVVAMVALDIMPDRQLEVSEDGKRIHVSML